MSFRHYILLLAFVTSAAPAWAVEGDTFLPTLDKAEWLETERTHYPADDKHTYPYDFVELVKAAHGGHRVEFLLQSERKGFSTNELQFRNYSGYIR